MNVIRVIVADDHPLVLRGIVDFLATAKDICIVGACADGVQALNSIRELKPDLAMLDLSMPHMNGLDVLTAANRENLATRVLFLAAAASPRDIITAMAEGAYGFLQKDSQPHELLHCIREIADGRKCMPFELFGRAQEIEASTTPIPVEKLLTQREWKVMALAAEGLSNKEIGRRLNITAGTAKIHLHNIFRKVGVKGRIALANVAFHYSNTKREIQ
jgi:two-component system nitrate/nitrite response regulator NarL